MNKKSMYQLCNEKQWFTHGDCEQYDKLFYAVKGGATIHDLAIILWICSSKEHCIGDITFTLETEWNGEAF